MRRASHLQGSAAVGLGVLLYILVLGPLQSLPRPTQDEVLRVALPGYLQVLMAGGDRHLAANIGVFRAMMLGGQVKDSHSYKVQGKLQQQVAILNPRQEDNSYIAAAILPWWGQVEQAQFVLDLATRQRDWDYMPPFFQGFNEYYFNKNYQRAAELVELSASRTEGVNRESFRDVAAKWHTLGDDPRAAVGVITALKEASQDPRMERRLQARIDRLNALIALREAAQRYQHEQGEPLAELSQLEQRGYLDKIPRDPFQYGYDVDSRGQVHLRSRQQKQ